MTKKTEDGKDQAAEAPKTSPQDVQMEQMAARLAELEKENAELKKQKEEPAPEAKAEKVIKLLKVVSLKDRNYFIDGQCVTPDKPVSLEWYEGNYLDAQMKAGLVGEYKA